MGRLRMAYSDLVQLMPCVDLKGDGIERSVRGGDFNSASYCGRLDSVSESTGLPHSVDELKLPVSSEGRCADRGNLSPSGCE